MPGITLPPFPDNVPTHPLLIVDYHLLKSGDQQEVERLWRAGQELGFWYLKNHDLDREVDEMFQMGAETMNLPLDEKMKFEEGDDGMSFGYKAAGANIADREGNLDTVEFLNIAKDDALAWPNVARREYPSTVNARMESTISPFVRKSVDINNHLLEIFNTKLGLPEGALAKRHHIEELSGCQSRFIKRPPSTEVMTEARAAIGAHTDFGSLTLLHNRLGGLQVLVPETDEWQYVKPLAGHAICNIGDTLQIFSGGLLRSNTHRVVPPPGVQSEFERWSLVYFTRPGNSVSLRALVEDSPIIADAVTNRPETKFETGATAYEWFTRRVKTIRTNNWKGSNTWDKFKGTEPKSI